MEIKILYHKSLSSVNCLFNNFCSSFFLSFFLFNSCNFKLEVSRFRFNTKKISGFIVSEFNPRFISAKSFFRLSFFTCNFATIELYLLINSENSSEIFFTFCLISSAFLNIELISSNISVLLSEPTIF